MPKVSKLSSLERANGVVTGGSRLFAVLHALRPYLSYARGQTLTISSEVQVTTTVGQNL